MSKQYTRDQVAKHNTEDDLWIIIDAKVYDVTKFRNMHPGGSFVFITDDIPGQDATEAFYGLHRHEVLERPQYKLLQIGTIQGEEPEILGNVAGALSKVPYAEPTWLADGYYSPYFRETHKKFQAVVRKFVDEVIYPDAMKHEADGKRFSQDVLEKLAALNIIAMRMGPGKHLKGLTLWNGLVTSEEFDYFHELILTQEIARIGFRGFGDGFLAGTLIGLPPILNFGRPELSKKVAEEVFTGKKIVCLAISEAFAGSDVAGLKTYAKKTEDGKHWIINGTKKWITNGTFADYFTVGCRTDNGFTVILVDRHASEGLETKPIKTSYSPTAGTAFVTLENVKVPIENTLGEEGKGIFVILSNFNHERFIMCGNSAMTQRSIIEECLKWIHQRKAFGKPLTSLAVIRNKLAAMIARTESVQSWLENITYQINNMSYKEQSAKLAGPIALLKMYSTRCAQETATDAVQIFGGRGISATGMGAKIEHYHRTVTFDAILGGSEDVLGDLGVRQAIKNMPKNARL